MEEGYFGQACKHKGWSRVKLVFSAPLPTSTVVRAIQGVPCLELGATDHSVGEAQKLVVEQIEKLYQTYSELGSLYQSSFYQ